jgi:hypothetical protein
MTRNRIRVLLKKISVNHDKRQNQRSIKLQKIWGLFVVAIDGALY